MKPVFLIVFLLTWTISFSQENVQWRGKNRDGIYDETGLLKKWPEAGPELLWHYDGLGVGHASAVVSSEKVFTAGTIEGMGFVIALDHSGKEIWKTEYGKEWVENWDGVRSTPVFDHGKIYMLSAYGLLVCLDANDGKKLWSVDVFKDYDGENIKWGITENLLIDEDKLFCVPGGKEANVIALDKNSGKLIWKSAGNGEESAYCSPVVINHGGKKIFVTMTTSHILGLDANSGTLLWKHEQTNKWSVHANTPLYKDGYLYCVSGYGKGGVMLKLSDDGNSVTEVWRNSSLDNKMAGVILWNDKLYGSGDANKEWFCIDWKTGEQLSEWKGLKPGNVIFADGMLYCYDVDGKVGLVEPRGSEFNLISSFNVPYGEKQHWAHLVISGKNLYVRHGASLMVYKISE